MNIKELQDEISIIKDKARSEEDKDEAYLKAFLMVNGKPYTDEME